MRLVLVDDCLYVAVRISLSEVITTDDYLQLLLILSNNTLLTEFLILFLSGYEPGDKHSWQLLSCWLSRVL